MANTDLDENKVKILGGFFVYRAKPTSESKTIDNLLQNKGNSSINTEASTQSNFEQKGEITGMVLIKKFGDRQFMTYAPIDTTTYTIDKFMDFFKDTMYNNEYDNNIEKVFEVEALGNLINKLIVQTVEKDS
jgi:hypothetical protein